MHKKGILTNTQILFLYEMLPCYASVCEHYRSDNISSERTSVSKVVTSEKTEKIVERWWIYKHEIIEILPFLGI